MNYKDILNQFKEIKTIKVNNNVVVVNGVKFEYKYKQVAQKVANILKYFKI